MSTSSAAEEAAPFIVLTDWLTGAVQDEGMISLPDETITLFKSGIIDDDNGILVFLKLFGSPDHTNRLRLDHGAFMNLVAILLHLPYSHYQEKLLFAFMTTMELLKDTRATQAIIKCIKHIPSTAEDIETKRRKINNKLIPKMVRVLARDDQEASMRTMAAQILLALLQESAEAQEIARKQPEIMKLGPLIDDDEDYIVRLFTANAVRSMCMSMTEAHEFWPKISRKENNHMDFPLARSPDSAWLRAMVDYLSSKDVSRGFHGDSRPLVSGLLSIDTGSQIFEDRPKANILSLVADRFLFVIPGSATTPLALLELWLDSYCECFIDEQTSQDFRSDIGDNVVVHIESKGRGYQLFRGVKSALDTAELTFPGFHQGEAFVDKALQSLQASSPVKDINSKNAILSSGEESRSFRRLDVGMIDVSSNSDAEDDMLSGSGADAIIHADANIKPTTLRRSRSRQSSRTTEAKLKETHRNKISEATAFKSQGSPVLGPPGELLAQRQSIDPRMLMLHKNDITVDFATYIEQNSHHHPRPSQHDHRRGDEVRRVDAKPLLPSGPSDGTRQSTVPSQRVESSPSNWGHRPTSKQLVPGELHPSNILPPKQCAKPERSTAKMSNAYPILKHRKVLSLRSESDHRRSLEAAAGKMSAATGTDSDAQPRKTQILKRPSKSQTSTTHPMDWDVGDMANNTTALPATKKAKLKETSARTISGQSLLQAQVDEKPKQFEDCGAGSGLKRPRVVKDSHQSTQKTSMAKHAEFDIEDDDDETPVRDLQANKVAKKRTTKAATEKIDSQGSKAIKAVPGKPALKERKALKQPDTNTTSHASTRGRRGPPKSKRYNDDSNFTPDLGDHGLGEKATDVSLETANDRIARNKIPATKNDKKARVLSPHLRESAEVSTEKINKQAGKLHPDHDLPIGPLKPAAESANENSEVIPVHETLVTASSTSLSEAARSLVEESKNVQTLVVGASRNIQHQEPGRDSDREEQGQIAEDSYPLVVTKSQGPGASFGSKLGKMVQKSAPHETKANTIAVHKTPLSNARSFIGTVNKASVSPKKKPAQATMVDNSKTKAAQKRRPGHRSPEVTTKAVKHQSTIPTLKSKKQLAVPYPQDVKVATRISDDITGGQKDPLQQDATASEEAKTTNSLPENEQASKSLRSNLPRKAKSSNMRSTLEGSPETEEPSREKQGAQDMHKYDQSHMIEQKIEFENANTTIDLTLDSDNPVPVGGKGDLDRKMQDSHKDDDDEPPTRMVLTTRLHNTVESSIDQEAAGPAPKYSTRAVEAKKHAIEKTGAAKIPNSAKVVTPARSSQRDKPADFQGSTSLLTETTTKKAQLVHFGKYGPQNQAIPSPDKQGRTSIAGLALPPETQKHQGYKQRRSVPAIPNPFLSAPQLRLNVPSDAGEVALNDQGNFVGDGAVMEDAGDHSTQEDSEVVCSEIVDEEGLNMMLDQIVESNSRVKTRKLQETFPNETVRHCHQALLKKKSIYGDACQYLMDKPSAPIATRHLPTEMVNIGGSRSQSSRVDENGSPRLQPQLPVDPDHLTVSEVDVSPGITDDSNCSDEEDLATSPDESASAEAASQDSDPSFHLIREATVPAQSDRKTRTRSQYTTAAVPSPTTVKKTGPKPFTAAMKAKREPRESIGLARMLQEKYPHAQETLTMSPFKKPALKTAVTKTLDVAPAISTTYGKTPVEAFSSQRLALKEISANYNRPSITEESSQSQSTDFSSAGQHRVTKPHSKSPLRPYPSSDTSRRTPVSLKTRLLEKQSGKDVKREDTILENLQRGKSSRRDAEDADRTLVEGGMEHQHRRRRLSEASSVSSDSSPPVAERGTSSRKDQKLWRNSSREGHTGLRDALLKITNNVLFRLKSEERAIRLKVQAYDHGGNNVISHFRRTNTELFLHAGVTLFEKGTATKKELDTAFDGLQARKKKVRNIDSTDHGQRAVTLRHRELEEKTMQMLNI